MDEGLNYILNQGHTIGKAEGLTKVFAKELLKEQRKLREMQKTLPPGSLELNQQIAQVKHLEDRGKYVPTGQSETVLKQLLQDKQAAYRTGEQPRPLEFTPGKNTVFDPKQQKIVGNPLGATSQADFQAQMGKAGFDEATSQTLSDKVQSILHFTQCTLLFVKLLCEHSSKPFSLTNCVSLLKDVVQAFIHLR